MNATDLAPARVPRLRRSTDASVAARDARLVSGQRIIAAVDVVPGNRRQTCDATLPVHRESAPCRGENA